MRSLKNYKINKNIIFITLGSLVIAAVILYFVFRKKDTYNSSEHTISADGCPNLKNNFSSKMSKLDKCGYTNKPCNSDDSISLKSFCPTLTNIFIVHDSVDIDRSAGKIWAITNVLAFSRDQWNSNITGYKKDGWVPCGKNIGTIPGVYPEPLDTNDGSSIAVYLCVRYQLVDVNSTTQILTALSAHHFSGGKAPEKCNIVTTIGNIPKNLISGTTSLTTSCYAVGGCATYEDINKVTTYARSLMLNYVGSNSSAQLNRYAIGRNVSEPKAYPGIMLTFPSQRMKAIDWKYKTNNDISPLLSFGDILALGGDFYGVPDEPITDIGAAPNLEEEKRRFMNCFNTLNDNVGDELSQIMVIFSQTMQEINNYLIDGRLPSDYYKNSGYTNDIAFNNITGGGSDKLPSVFNDSIAGMVFKGRYLNLAENNYDHFCEKTHAYRAYMAGHTIAKDTAVIAKTTNNPDLLNMAYAYEAFACHFLSDHFSSGHMRVPREDLHLGRKCSWWNGEYDWFTLAGDYCSKLMHDEDNKLGLVVANNACYENNPDPSICKVWRSYGDAYLTDPQNQDNLIRQQEVLQISVDEVWNSYNNGDLIENKVWRYLPCVDESKKIPILDNANKITGYHPNIPIYNDTLGRTPVKIGEHSSLNHTPMFLAPDPEKYGNEYNCLYKREKEGQMTYIFSPSMAIADFKFGDDYYFPGVTH